VAAVLSSVGKRTEKGAPAGAFVLQPIPGYSAGGTFLP
jgi:hypothetical protein